MHGNMNVKFIQFSTLMSLIDREPSENLQTETHSLLKGVN
jgi:hypothetical protein